MFRYMHARPGCAAVRSVRSAGDASQCDVRMPGRISLAFAAGDRLSLSISCPGGHGACD